MPTNAANYHRSVRALARLATLTAICAGGVAGYTHSWPFLGLSLLTVVMSTLLTAYTLEVRDQLRAQALLIVRLFKDVNPEYHPGILAKVTGKDPSQETLRAFALLSRLNEKDAIKAIESM